MMDKDVFFEKRVRELADMAYNRNIVTFTGFLNLNELHMVNSLPNRNLGIHLDSCGGYDFAERRIVAFIPDALSYDWDYPIQCICIQNKSAKFGHALTHRDYLGALIHLGIERYAIGDILVEKDCAYLFCQEHLAEFITQNLCRVGHTNVLPKLLTQITDFPSPQFETITGSVASIRLDSVIALAFHASRSSLVQNIENGNVFVNGKQITSNGYALKEGDLVSLRGKGKFQFMESGGKSKKGRLFVTINRYI